mgnify:CR=1 FL=1
MLNIIKYKSSLTFAEMFVAWFLECYKVGNWHKRNHMSANGELRGKTVRRSEKDHDNTLSLTFSSLF